ncbi:MAG: head-tail connector protein [Litorimonas sp.]
MLTDLQPPPAEPITLAEAKTFLRVDQNDDDALIQTLIQSARERLEDRLGVAMIRRAMRVSATGGTVALPRHPVVSIDAVDADGEPVDPVDANLRCRPATLTLPTDSAVEVTFTAGYGPTPPTVPAPLRQAMLLLVAHGYENREGLPDAMPLMVDALTMPYRGIGL